MAERIIPATTSLAEREQRAIDDMRALFPNGIVTGLDSKDRALGKRLSALYRPLGYSSRGEMISALGFRQEASDNKGGRPASVVPDELFDELARRYEGRPKPKSIGMLKHDNPDLVSKIKTVSNRCTEIYGHTVTVELIRRGLLDKRLPATKERLGEDEVRKAVAELENKYASASDKPKTIAQLKKLEPEYAAALDSLAGNRGREIFGLPTTAYFKQLGILAGSTSAVNESEIIATLDALQEAYKGEPEASKPKTYAALLKEHPEHANAIRTGQKNGTASKEVLLERGILGLSKAALASRAKRLKERCARNASARDLIRLHIASGGKQVALPADDAQWLRPGVVGIDLDCGYELREAALLVKDPSLSVGDELQTSWEVSTGWGSTNRLAISRDGSNVGLVYRPQDDDFIDYREYDVESPLIGEAGTIVVKVENLADKSLARVRHRFITPVSRETMLYALYRLGALSDSELYENDDAWRDRLNVPAEESAEVD